MTSDRPYRVSSGTLANIVVLGLVGVISAASIGAGVLFWRYQASGTPADVTVDWCTDWSSGTRIEYHCYGTWVIDGQPGSGYAEGVGPSDVGTTVALKVKDGAAYREDHVGPPALIAGGVIFMGVVGLWVARGRRRRRRLLDPAAEIAPRRFRGAAGRAEVRLVGRRAVRVTIGARSVDLPGLLRVADMWDFVLYPRAVERWDDLSPVTAEELARVLHFASLSVRDWGARVAIDWETIPTAAAPPGADGGRWRS